MARAIGPVKIKQYSLCSPDELERGTAKLAADLRSGSFDSVKAAYDSEGGDYAFLIGRTEG